MSDYQKLIDVLVEEQTPASIANETGETLTGIRGQVSRGLANEKTVTGVLADLSAPQLGLHNEEIEQQLEIIERSKKAFKEHQKALLQKDEVTILFISDLHIPYWRLDAVRLVLQIAKYIKPDWITSFNDMFDFATYSRWENQAVLWENSITRALKAIKIYHKALLRAAPRAKLIQVMGNHDKRLYKYLRSNPNGFGEWNILHFMQEMENQKVLQFTNNEQQQPTIHITPGLKLAHGWFASKNRNTVGRNTIEKVAGRAGYADAGVFYNVAIGHTHEAAITKHLGVTCWNSGCMCSLNPPYASATPNTWTLGVTVLTADPRSRRARGKILDFVTEKNKLVCYYDNMRFETEVEEDKNFNI